MIQSCVRNLHHEGLMTISGSNVTIGAIITDPSSTVTLSNSVITMNLSQLYGSAGSFGGTGSVMGNFENYETGTMMAAGDDGLPSNLHVSEDFKNNGGIMFFSLNSRDLSSPSAFTKLTTGKGVALNGGTACICIAPDLSLQPGDRFDLIEANTLLDGTFTQVHFDCASCPTRTKRNVAATEDECEPTADYDSRSFSVLFEACDGSSSGSNFLTSITPPYYVIVPVAVGIILLLIIVFGGALLIDELIRKRRSVKRALQKRAKRIKELTDVEKSLNRSVNDSSSVLG